MVWPALLRVLTRDETVKRHDAQQLAVGIHPAETPAFHGGSTILLPAPGVAEVRVMYVDIGGAVQCVVLTLVAVVTERITQTLGSLDDSRWADVHEVIGQLFVQPLQALALSSDEDGDHELIHSFS